MRNLGRGIDCSPAWLGSLIVYILFAFIFNALRLAVPHEEEIAEGLIVSVVAIVLFFLRLIGLRIKKTA